MNIKIEEFQKSFKNLEANIKNYIIVVSILISIILLFMIINNKIEDYYFVQGEVHNENIDIIVDMNNLNKITNNKKIIINKEIFTYKIEKIEDYIYNNIIYKKITISLSKGNKDFLIDNNIVDGKIITNRITLIKYLLKTLKGE